MKEYMDQPKEGKTVEESVNIIRWIEDSLKEDLPECPTNEWFIESIHFANMVDKIMKEL